MSFDLFYVCSGSDYVWLDLHVSPLKRQRFACGGTELMKIQSSIRTQRLGQQSQCQLKVSQLPLFFLWLNYKYSVDKIIYSQFVVITESEKVAVFTHIKKKTFYRNKILGSYIKRIWMFYIFFKKFANERIKLKIQWSVYIVMFYIR